MINFKYRLKPVSLLSGLTKDKKVFPKDIALTLIRKFTRIVSVRK